jgi:thiazole/oxazole-forming peptide maturase SagD family component
VSSWATSAFTGLFRDAGPLPPRAHDPHVELRSGELARRDGTRLSVGGAGWDEAAAEAALVGEAIERLAPFPHAGDASVVASFASWKQDEPAIDPARFALFQDEQYRQPGFPFERLARETECRWTPFRDALSGEAVWVPEELAFLEPRPEERHHRFAPATSTGLSCGRAGHPVLLRGLEETIERDAILGAWLGSYALEEWEPARVLAQIEVPDLGARVRRPHLRYRFFRVATPFAAHVTIVTVEGEDREGFCFAAGSACRETRAASWAKSLLEAIQGWPFVRWLKSGRAPERDRRDPPRDFGDHAVYYALNPEELAGTPLRRARETTKGGDESAVEGVRELAARLGPARPVIFRNATPPEIASSEERAWFVLKVLVPGLTPLHGDDHFPHLGGALWGSRDFAEWRTMKPHPFP